MFSTWNNRRQLLEYPGKIFFRHCFQMILEFKRKFLKYFEFFVHLFDLTTTSHHLWMYIHILLNICAFSNVPNIATSLTETVHLCTSFDTSFTLKAIIVYWDGFRIFGNWQWKTGMMWSKLRNKESVQKPQNIQGLTFKVVLIKTYI